MAKVWRLGNKQYEIIDYLSLFVEKLLSIFTYEPVKWRVSSCWDYSTRTIMNWASLIELIFISEPVTCDQCLFRFYLILFIWVVVLRQRISFFLWIFPLLDSLRLVITHKRSRFFIYLFFLGFEIHPFLCLQLIFISWRSTSSLCPLWSDGISKEEVCSSFHF